MKTGSCHCRRSHCRRRRHSDITLCAIVHCRVAVLPCVYEANDHMVTLHAEMVYTSCVFECCSLSPPHRRLECLSFECSSCFHLTLASLASFPSSKSAYFELFRSLLKNCKFVLALYNVHCIYMWLCFQYATLLICMHMLIITIVYCVPFCYSKLNGKSINEHFCFFCNNGKRTMQSMDEWMNMQQ